MKTKLIFLSLVLGFVLISGPVFAKGPMKLDFSLQNVGTVKIGNRVVTTHSLAAMAAIESELEKRMGGTVDMVIHTGATLGNITECMEQAKLGVITGTLSTSAYLAKFVPETQVLSIPYLFPSNFVGHDVLTGRFGDEIIELIAKKSGFRVITMWACGFRNLGNNVRPIRTPADMKGLKMRTMPSPVHMEMMKLLGAKPTPVNWNEVYTALQTGLVDGMENTPSNITGQKWHEVTKYYTLDGHFLSIGVILVGESWFQKQSKELQQALIEAGKMGNVAGTGVYVTNEKLQLEEVKRPGVEIYAPTMAEKETFRKTAQPGVVEYLREKVGNEWIDKVLNAVETSKAKLGY